MAWKIGSIAFFGFVEYIEFFGFFEFVGLPEFVEFIGFNEIHRDWLRYIR